MTNDDRQDAVLEGIVRRQQEKDLERAEEDARRAADTVRRRRSPTLLLWIAIPGLLALTGFNVLRISGGPPTAFTAQEEARAAEFDLFLTASEIQSYRDEHGVLPATLLEIGEDAEGMEYVRNGDEYGIRIVHREGTLTYQSGDPLEPFGAAVDAAADAATAAEQRAAAASEPVGSSDQGSDR